MKEQLERHGRPLKVVLEVICIVALGLFAVLFIIPRETSGIGLGLNPSTVPTIAALVAAFLAAADGALRLIRSGPFVSSPLRMPALLIMSGVSVLTVFLLGYGGALLCVGIILPLLMLILGERRWLRILATTLTGVLVAYWMFA